MHSFIALQIILVHNEAIMVRYLYAFYLGTTGRINDELLWTYFLGLNAMLGSLGALWLILYYETEHLGYLYCVGKADGEKGLSHMYMSRRNTFKALSRILSIRGRQFVHGAGGGLLGGLSHGGKLLRLENSQFC